MTPGRRVKIKSSSQHAPKSWNDYLSNSDNKQDLPEYLNMEWQVMPMSFIKKDCKTPSCLFHMDHYAIDCRPMRGTFYLKKYLALLSRGEEADLCLILHAKHAAEMNPAAIIIRSSDTDVMVLAIYFQADIHVQLIIQCQSKKRKLINIPAVWHKLGNDVCKALPGLHSFSGCDTTSGFFGKSKAAFFSLLKADATFKLAMQPLGNTLKMTAELISKCEASICKLYKHDETDVNQVHYIMLAKGKESHEIPPTKDCLQLYMKRANFQAYLWKRGLEANFQQPSPEGHGWNIKDRVIDVHWMTKEPAPKAVLECISCKSCKLCSTRKCPCKANGFSCTDSCGCNVQTCENSDDAQRDRSLGNDSSDESDED